MAERDSERCLDHDQRILAGGTYEAIIRKNDRIARSARSTQEPVLVARHSRFTHDGQPPYSSVGSSVSDRSFSVSIEVIVKEKSTMFANIEADQLTLWKVSSIFSSAIPCS